MPTLKCFFRWLGSGEATTPSHCTSSTVTSTTTRARFSACTRGKAGIAQKMQRVRIIPGKDYIEKYATDATAQQGSTLAKELRKWRYVIFFAGQPDVTPPVLEQGLHCSQIFISEASSLKMRMQSRSLFKLVIYLVPYPTDPTAKGQGNCSHDAIVLSCHLESLFGILDTPLFNQSLSQFTVPMEGVIWKYLE